MSNFATVGHQPLGGLAFTTRGHYGSAVFDPMTKRYLEISVCDPCVVDLSRDGLVYDSEANEPLSDRTGETK